MEAILFIGIQASGKSTFYQRHFFHTHLRISLDLLNTRNKERHFIDKCLELQQRFVVDNTNPTRAERAGYIEKSKARKYRVVGYYFHTTIAEALERNAGRTGKQRISEVGIKATAHKLELPHFDEGFDEIIEVCISDGIFVTKTRTS